MDVRAQTYGERAVGVNFNPSGNDLVTQVKQHFARVIDALEDVAANTADCEIHALVQTAITHAQTACMWAVKALTWQH